MIQSNLSTNEDKFVDVFVFYFFKFKYISKFMFCVYIFNFKLKIILKNCIISNSLKMVTKKRGRYEKSDKGKMIHELDKHLHLKGPNIGKPNFYLVAQMYPEYSRKMLIDWYSKKDAILSSHHKHKRF